MKTNGGVRYIAPSYLASTLDGGEGSASLWVRLEVSLDAVKIKPFNCRKSNPAFFP
jgi:hypothetical protein